MWSKVLLCAMRMQATAWCGCFCRSASRQAAHDMYLSPPGYFVITRLWWHPLRTYCVCARLPICTLHQPQSCTNRSPAQPRRRRTSCFVVTAVICGCQAQSRCNRLALGALLGLANKLRPFLRKEAFTRLCDFPCKERIAVRCWRRGQGQPHTRHSTHQHAARQTSP